MVQDLQSRLQEARATESMLPAEIDELQQKLQQEFSQVQSREAGAHKAGCDSDDTCCDDVLRLCVISVDQRSV